MRRLDVWIIGILICFFVGTANSPVHAQGLKVVTFNLWHGLDTEGYLMFPDLEQKGRRERRFGHLLTLLKEESPDIVFLQEANPARSVAQRMAQELDMDEIHQVSNGGIKFGFGIPIHFKEGEIILAKKGLSLKRQEGVKLPGSGFGRCGDWFSFKVKEIRYSLIGSIHYAGNEIVVGGVHLHHVQFPTPHFRAALENACKKGELPAKECRYIMDNLREASEMRRRQIEWLARHLEEHYPGKPIILAGDFNATPESAGIQELTGHFGYEDTYALKGRGPGYTWDADRNSNVRYSDWIPMTKVRKRAALDAQEGLNRERRRIDYIFLNRAFDSAQILESRLFADQPVDSLFCSDHFGVMTRISCAKE